MESVLHRVNVHVPKILMGHIVNMKRNCVSQNQQWLRIPGELVQIRMRRGKNTEVNLLMYFLNYSACTISCQRGYKFPDGSTAANLVCRDGVWVPGRAELAALPDCEPICEPDCLNGGKCLAPNMCQCSSLYRGPLCQYSE